MLDDAKWLKAFAKRYREQEEADQAAAGKRLPGGADDLRALVKRVDAAKPARADVEALRAVLAEDDGAVLGAFAGLTLAKQALAASGAKGAALIVLEAELDRMRAAFGYEQAGPVERVLVDHVVTCWARLQLAENKLTDFKREGGTFQQGRYFEDALTSAQRRYLRAVGLLERLRRYSPPVMTVNIAGQQIVNVGEQGQPAA